ncbi:MAG: YchF-related putative GTPase [Candidatus Micrarchaeota archaeon]|nr:YchF-related putative GTPase [Candidatus Micrarchaeota archaeon]
MLIGVVGAPNKGKSTFFSAATLVDAAIANYPFTTINPNRGVTYVRTPCPHVAFGLPKCDPKNSRCVDGMRLVPINIIDVAGLVPGAHEGKGLGNKFLDNLREADALIQVVDGTGKTDLQGNPCDSCDPIAETGFLNDEVAYWLADIMLRGEGKPHGGMAHGTGSPGSAAVSSGVHEMAKRLSGLKIDETMLLHAAGECGLDIAAGVPNEEGALSLARAVLKVRMPIVVAFNKMDATGARENFEKVNGNEEAEEDTVGKIFPCSAAIELALRKAADHHLIDYVPGGKKFGVIGSPDEKQKEALVKMAAFVFANGGSGVQEIIDYVVYKKLKGIVVFPVEDEHKFTNHKGEVLPDAFLVPQGTTVHQLAGMVHTDLANKFIGAVDVKRKMRVGADHALANGDVIKIVAGR